MSLSISKLRSWNWKLFIDSFIIFLNISNSYSLIPYLFFFQYYRAVNSGLIAIINLIYIIIRLRKNVTISRKDDLFFLFILINVVNVFFGLATDTFGIGMFPFIFSNATFYIILYGLFNMYLKVYPFEKSIWLLLRGYIWLVAISIAGTLTLFLLIKVFNVNPMINDIGSNMDLFQYNIRDKNNSYFFPYGLSVFFKTLSIRIPFFQKDGIIVGFFHEPHTFAFLVIPSIFLLLHKFKHFFSKIFLIFIYILVMLIVASAVNFMAMLLCIIAYVVFKYRKKPIYALLSLGVIFIVFLVVDPHLYQFIIDKILSRSTDYILSMLKFAFTPNTLIGTNFYDLSYIDTYWNDPNPLLNIGFITFLLNIMFLIIFIYKIYIVNINYYKEFPLIGLFFLYFLFHSIKVSMYAYSLSYLIFIIFLVNAFITHKSVKKMIK